MPRKETNVNEMIERVAMAIAIKDITWRGANTKDARQRILRTGGPTSIQIRQARAAIEAMREPNDEMVKAGWLTGIDNTPCIYWQAMIDAALSDAA